MLSENTTRAVFYVAMSRGRHGNTAYLTQQPGQRGHKSNDPSFEPDAGPRFSSWHAAQVARAIIGNDAAKPRTAHDVAEDVAGPLQVPARVAPLLRRRQRRTAQRQTSYAEWQRTQWGTALQIQDEMSQGRHPEQVHGINR